MEIWSADQCHDPWIFVSLCQALLFQNLLSFKGHSLYAEVFVTIVVTKSAHSQNLIDDHMEAAFLIRQLSSEYGNKVRNLF